jgi:hypothetical protein
MQQPEPMEPTDSGQDEYMTLLAVQREVGVTRETLRKYLLYLGIEPICFHIGTRSLYISREAMARVKQLKQNPTLLHRLKFPMRRPEENTIHGEHGTS